MNLSITTPISPFRPAIFFYFLKFQLIMLYKWCSLFSPSYPLPRVDRNKHCEVARNSNYIMIGASGFLLSRLRLLELHSLLKSVVTLLTIPLCTVCVHAWDRNRAVCTTITCNYNPPFCSKYIHDILLYVCRIFLIQTYKINKQTNYNGPLE
jgi:hypothetical protein